MASPIIGSAKKQKEFKAELDYAIAHHVSPTKAVTSPDEKIRHTQKNPADAQPNQSKVDTELSSLWKRYERNHTSENASEDERKWNQNIFRHVESKYGLETAKAMYGSAEALRRSGVKTMHRKYGIEEMKEQERDLLLTELVTVVRNQLPPADNFIDRSIRRMVTSQDNDVTELQKKQQAVAKRMLRAKASLYTERGISRGLKARTHGLLRMGSLKTRSNVPVVAAEQPPITNANTTIKPPKVFRPSPAV